MCDNYDDDDEDEIGYDGYCDYEVCKSWKSDIWFLINNLAVIWHKDYFEGFKLKTVLS